LNPKEQEHTKTASDEKTNEKMLLTSAVNTEYVDGGTMPTWDRTRGRSSYLKRFSNKIAYLKMAN
jgi:hypothetical protein